MNGSGSRGTFRMEVICPVSFQPTGQRPSEPSRWQRFVAWATRDASLPLERYAREAVAILFVLSVHGVFIGVSYLTPEEGRWLPDWIVHATGICLAVEIPVLVGLETLLACYRAVRSVWWEMRNWKPDDGNHDSTNA